MTARMTIYLSGPITGNTNYKPLFGHSEEQLKRAGYLVLSPLWHTPATAPAEQRHPDILGLPALPLSTWLLPEGERA